MLSSGQNSGELLPCLVYFSTINLSASALEKKAFLLGSITRRTDRLNCAEKKGAVIMKRATAGSLSERYREEGRRCATRKQKRNRRAATATATSRVATAAEKIPQRGDRRQKQDRSAAFPHSPTNLENHCALSESDLVNDRFVDFETY